MTGRDKEDEDREIRYAHLLQPNRDLAANWAVDVARELEGYLAELSLTSLFEDGNSSLNFAEAALLIQGSIQIYSRKVEYLYALVLQALDFIAQKRQQAQQEQTSIQPDGKDTDVFEDKEEDFLNLDDVPEEANIDIDDEANGAVFATPAVKPPPSLLVVEGDNLDVSGDAGELASYQISTSSLHRGFLLLDPCDADAVDEYLNADKAHSRKETPSHPSSSTRHRTPRGGFSSPRRKAGSVQDLETRAPPSGNCSVQKNIDHNGTLPNHNGADMWHGGMEGGGIWEEGCPGENMCDKRQQENCFHAEGNDYESPGIDDDDDEDVDPWVPLNPHESGSLPVKPYKRGRLYRKQKIERLPEVFGDFPLATRNGTNFPEFSKALQALECRKREAHCTKHGSQSPSPYEKLRSSFNLHGPTAFDVQRDLHDGSEGLEMQEDLDCEDGTWDADEQPADVYEPNFVENFFSEDPSQRSSKDNEHKVDYAENSEKERDEGMSFEDLCRAHLDAMLKNLAESEVRTELATRVSNWKQKIERSLAKEEQRPPFDIHVYGERVLENLQAEDTSEKSPGQKSFSNLVRGQERQEVARTFASLLQLVNNGNVFLEKGTGRNASFCFTAESAFSVRLLSSHKSHEEMLHYRAPSRALRNSGKKRSQNGKRGSSQISPLKAGGTDAASFPDFLKQAPNMSFSTHPCTIFSPQRASRGKQIATGRADSGSDLWVMSGSNGKLGGLKLTPKGKRRRRRQSIESVQMQLPGG